MNPSSNGAGTGAPDTPRFPEHVLRLPRYVPGKPTSELAREIGRPADRIVKLASNENPLGMSEQARAALLAALAESDRYPDADGHALKEALSRRWQVPHPCIVLGNGSNDLLEVIADAMLAPGRTAVHSQYAFAVYGLATAGAGAQSVVVPAIDYGHDLQAMRAAIRPDTGVVFVANPNNPTGTLLPADRLEAFIADVPRSVLVVLDEAYDEYLDDGERADSVQWVKRYPHLAVVRTFSKAFGLAGLRVGYAIAQAGVADVLNRVRQPFNTSVPAQAAAAASLADEAFVARTRAMNRAGLQQLYRGLDRLGVRYQRSHANFVLAHFDDARAVNAALLAAGVIVRPVANYGLPDSLRISVGLEEENATFLDALERALRG